MPFALSVTTSARDAREQRAANPAEDIECLTNEDNITRAIQQWGLSVL